MAAALIKNKLFTIQEVADILGVSTKTLRRWDQRGRFVPTRTAGNQRRYTQEQISKFKVQSSKFKVSHSESLKSTSEPFFREQEPQAPKYTQSLPSVIRGLPSGSVLRHHFLLGYESQQSEYGNGINEPKRIEEGKGSLSNRGQMSKFGSSASFKINPVKMGIMFAGLVLMLSVAGSVLMARYNLVAGLAQKKDQFAKFIANLPQVSISLKSSDLSFVPQGNQSVLAATTGGSDLVFNVNIPAFFSQSVGIGTTTVNPSAILDLTSEDKGFLAPRMTTAQRDVIGSPAAGLFVYNTDTNQYNMYNGTSWKAVGASVGDVTAGDAFTKEGSSGNSLYFHGTGGGVGQLTGGAISGTQTYTFPNASGEISLLGQSISNSELVNSKITISPGTNMTGGGEVALGSSVTLTLKDSIALAGTLDVSGATTLNSTIGLGDATTDAITFTGRIAQDSSIIPITATGINDLGSSTLPWDSIYGNDIYADNILLNGSTGTAGYWKRSLGALSTATVTDDVLIGGTATASAKFGFINIASGNPTATISSNLSLIVPTGNASTATFNLLNNGTLNIQRSPGGDAGLASALFIQNNGNVGIGTTNPTQVLDINGTAKSTGVIIGTLTGILKGTSGTVGTATSGTDYVAGGTGAANQIAYFTGTGALTGSSNLWFNGFSIGVGTTAPLAMFSVGSNSDVRINGTGDVTARTFNGITLATGSGTLTMGANSLDIGTGGTLGSNAFNSTAFMTGVTGTANQINVAGTTAVTLSLAPDIKLIGDVTAKTFNGNTIATGSGNLTITGTTSVSGTNTGDQNLWATINSQSGSTVANTTTDTLTINGAGIAATAISGDTLTVTATEADTLASVTGRGATTTTQLGFNYNSGAPFMVLNNTEVTNLNANYLEGHTSSYFQTALTNPVTGTGTQNYVAKWGAAGIVNSNIYDNAYAVGVGTTSPLALLSIGANSDVRINGTGDVTAKTFNGNTIATGSGTLSLSSNSLTVSGTGTACLQGSPDCGFAFGTNYWQLNSGLLSPGNNTVDFAIGGTSTTSAKFAFVNIASGNPTATISSNLSLIVPTGNASTATFNLLNNGTLNIQRSPGGDAGLASALFIQNNGNVGIGTTSPTQLLQVAGLAQINTGLIVPKIYPSADSTTAVQINKADGTTSVLNIDTTNVRVGIGTTEPAQALDIQKASGVINLQSTIGTNGSYLKTVNSGGTSYIGVAGSSGSTFLTSGELTYALVLSAGISQTNAMQFGTNQAARMTILNGGNVGIGITAPVGVLQVNGIAGGNAAAIINNEGSVGDIFTASSSGTPRFTVANNGNLTATGTLTGLTGLTSSGTITFSGFTSNGGPLYTNATGVLAQATAGTSSQCLLGGTTPSFGSCGTGLALDNLWNQTTGMLYPNNTTVDFAIGGTSTQSAKFAVLNINSGTPVASIAGTISLGGAVGTTRTIGATAMNSLQLGDSSTGDLIFAPANSTAMTIKNGGNVGIGTTAPGALLDVVSTTAGARFGRTNDQLAIDTYGTISDTGGAVVINDLQGVNLDGDTPLTVDTSAYFAVDSGNVGIGTTTPLEILGVTGNASISGTLAVNTIKPLTGALNLQYKSGANAWSNGLTILDNSGNVGIGTTAPGAKLDVNGTLTVTGSNLTTLGGNLTVTGTAWTATPTISGLITATSGLTSNGTVAVNAAGGITTNQATFPLLNDTATAINFAGAAATLNIGALTGTATINNATTAITGALLANGDVTLGNAITDNITFTGRVAQDADLIPITATGTNDLGSATLPWDNLFANNVIAGGTSGIFGWLQRNNNSLSPTNITDDFLLGGISTASARFGILNMASGNPTATMSSNLSLIVPTGNAPAATLNLLNNGTLNIQRSAGGDAGLTSAMFIQNNGNVGIGNTAPSRKLTVTGDASFSSPIYVTGNRVYFTSGQLFEETANTLISLKNNADTEYISLKALNLYATGNVGIGNTTPLTALDVTGSASLSANLSLKGAGTAHTFNILDNGTLNIQRSPGGDAGLASVLFVQSNGNIGIGTTAPSEALDIAKGTSQGLRISGTGGNNGIVLGGYSNTITTEGNRDINLAANGTGDIVIATDADTDFNVGSGKLFVNGSSGNVGIGITAPVGVLQVNGIAGGNAAMIVNNAGTVGDIFTASSSGTPRFTVANNGNLTATGTLTGLTGLTSSGTITFSGFTSNGGPLYTNATGVLAQTTAGTTTQVLHGGTTPSFSAVSLTADVTGILPTANGGSFWNSSLGALYPGNTTMDLLIGGTASSSAKFGFINVAGGTPTATVSGTTGATYLTATGTIQTTNNQQLILGGATTGDITLSPLNGSGTTLSTGILNLSTGKVFQIAGTTVLSNNTLGTGVLTSSLTAVGTIGTGVWQGTSVKADYGGTGLTTYAQGDILYAGSLNPTALSKLTAGTAGYVLTTGGAGANPSWTDPAVAVGNFWRQNTGVLYSANSTVDLLIGGTSTDSAKFAVLNINSGTPVASIAGTISLGGAVGTTRTIGATAMNSLQLGDSSTGDLIFAPANSARMTIKNSGNIGIGTTAPSSLFSVGSTSQFQVSSTGAVTAVGVNSGSGLIQGTGGLTVSGNTTLAATAGNTVAIGNGTGTLALTSSALNVTTLGAVSGVTTLGLSGAITGATATNTINGLIINSGALSGVSTINMSGILTNTSTGNALTLSGAGANLAFTGAGLAQITTASNQNLALMPGGTGNVGIGTTAPGALLTLANNGWFGGISTASGTTNMFKLNTADQIQVGASLNVDGSLVFPTDAGYVTAMDLGLTSAQAANTANGYVFRLGTANVMTVYGENNGSGVLQNGRVGIGTTLPLTALDVTGSASLSADLSLRGQATNHLFNILNNGTLNIQRSPGGDVGLATALYVGSGGNIGIGTTAPATLLDVNGAATFRGNINFLTYSLLPTDNNGNIGGPSNRVYGAYFSDGGINETGATSATGLLNVNSWNGSVAITNYAARILNNITSSTNSINKYGLYISSTGSFSGTSTNNYAMYVDTPSGAVNNYAAIFAGGNVGIGNTTPLTALDVTGSASLSADLSLRGAGTNHLFNILQNGTLNIQRSPGGDAGLATALYVGNNGNIGIGTTAPGAKLSVVGDSLLYSANAGYSEGTNVFYTGASASGGGYNLHLGAANTAPGATTMKGYLRVRGAGATGNLVMGIYGGAVGNDVIPLEISNASGNVYLAQAAGNVGIGTTAPTQKFQIGDTAVGSAFVGMQIVSADGGFYLGTDDNKTFFDAGRNGVYDLTLDAVGNVGIGTTAPGALLTLANNGWFGGISTASGTTNMFKLNTADQIQVGSSLSIDGSFNLPADGGYVTAMNMPMLSAGNGVASGYVFRMGSSNIMTIYGENSSGVLANGRVGIGTTGPGTPLDVRGGTGTVLQVAYTDGTKKIQLDGYNRSIDSYGGTLNLNYGTSLATTLGLGGGNVGIGCSDPDHLLELGGTGTGCNTGTGSWIAAGSTAFTANSSREWKENIQTYTMPDILSRIQATPARTFDWKSEYCTGADCTNNLGFIAQEFFGVLGRGDNLHVNGQDIMMAEWLGIQALNLNLESMTLQGEALRNQDQTLQAQIDQIATSSANVNYILANDPLFDSLDNKVANLQAKIDLLSLQVEQQASISAFLAGITNQQVLGASTSAALNATLGDVELNNATISDSLNVLGRTTVTDLGVTGNINAGLLAIHGIDGEIGTLAGDLYLQKNGLGGVDILDGKVTIDTAGNMTMAGTVTAGEIEANSYTVLGDQSIGSATIPAYATSIEIFTPVASTSSKIFLTATSLTDKQITVVKKSDGKFKVAIPTYSTTPISFDWWIVGNK